MLTLSCKYLKEVNKRRLIVTTTAKIIKITRRKEWLNYSTEKTLYIVSLFNNELNTSAQLLFTAQDAMLLDCKKLFRKDQIWFAAKNDEGAYVYPLSTYTAQKDNIRSETDLIERYKTGDIGELPIPDLISVLLEDYDDE